MSPLARLLVAVASAAFVGMALASPGEGAKAPEVLPLWPGQVPGDHGSFEKEQFRLQSGGPVGSIRWLDYVTTPTLTVYRPPRRKDTGTAVIVCPGGGYWELAWDVEGEEVAAWLNSIGVTAILLKYRVPRRPGEPETLPAPGPLLDAQRAVSMVRSRAAEWRIDPQRIGIVGFSAGGHLALATATHFDRRGYEPVDAVDQASCRPDFSIAVYPGYLVEKERDVLTSHIRIPAETPPALLIHASDDKIARAENSVVMYQALKQAGVSAELHVYSAGGHGFGVRKLKQPSSTWTERCVEWLQGQAMLKR
jgi:acetyl esterase/lipase